MTLFSEKEFIRYQRHFQLPQFGTEGQIKLKNSRIAIVGCGGLGSPVSLYLAAAGVGSITLIDGDTVELSNLQRQIAFNEHDLGQSKAEICKKRLEQLNSSIEIIAKKVYLKKDNIGEHIKNHDLVLDCCDNMATRYAINDYCYQQSIPWIYASIFQFSGQCALFKNNDRIEKNNTACFRCIFPDTTSDLQDCNTAGVIGVLPGIVGCIQANEAIKYLAAITNETDQILHLIETLPLNIRNISLQKNPECCCNHDDFPEGNLSNKTLECNTTNHFPNEWRIKTEEFNAMLNNHNIQLIDVRSAAEHAAYNIGGENIELGHILQNPSSITKGKTNNSKQKILVYCLSGNRSQTAVSMLRENDYEAFSLCGGIMELLKQKTSLSH